MYSNPPKKYQYIIFYLGFWPIANLLSGGFRHLFPFLHLRLYIYYTDLSMILWLLELFFMTFGTFFWHFSQFFLNTTQIFIKVAFNLQNLRLLLELSYLSFYLVLPIYYSLFCSCSFVSELFVSSSVDWSVLVFSSVSLFWFVFLATVKVTLSSSVNFLPESGLWEMMVLFS